MQSVISYTPRCTFLLRTSQKPLVLLRKGAGFERGSATLQIGPTAFVPGPILHEDAAANRRTAVAPGTRPPPASAQLLRGIVPVTKNPSRTAEAYASLAPHDIAAVESSNHQTDDSIPIQDIVAAEVPSRTVTLFSQSDPPLVRLHPSKPLHESHTVFLREKSIPTLAAGSIEGRYIPPAAEFHARLEHLVTYGKLSS